MCVFRREVLASPEDQHFIGDVIAIGHAEMQALSLLIARRVKRAGAHEHGNHVKDTFREGVGGITYSSVTILVTLFEQGLSVLIVIPHFVNRIALALEGSLAIVEGLQRGCDISQQGVTHEEVFVCSLAAARDEMATIGLFALITGGSNVHLCRSGFDPDEFPIEEELVFQVLPTVERRILKRALCTDGRGHKEYTEKEEVSHDVKRMIGFVLIGQGSCDKV